VLQKEVTALGNACRRAPGSVFLASRLSEAKDALETALSGLFDSREKRFATRISDAKSTWKALKRAKKGLISIPLFADCKSAQDTVNSLNTFFSDVPRMAVPSEFASFHRSISSSSPLVFPSRSPLFSDPFSLLELETALGRKGGSAVGPDGVFRCWIEQSGPVFQRFLLDLFNYSFANGVVPTTWRVAKVLPAYKNKGARSSPASYRPISITSTVARLFERMVHARLISFFLSHNHLSECQFGFRRGRNTRDCLFVATEIIKESLRADSSVFGAFIDIIRAFDSVPIYALLHKLTRLGVDGNMLRWLHEFLSHRSVTTSWPGTCLSSPAAPLHCGLPQGCVLSPLLFIVYINDLLMDLNTFCPRIVVLCFADDLALFTRGGLVSDQRAYLQQGLNILSTWCRRWLLLCSEDKSAVVLFSRNRALLSRPVAQFKLQDFLLSFAQSYRYLGVILDSSLTWSEHSSSVLRKVNSAVVRLHQVVAANRFFSPVQVIHLVKVLVVPIFTYSFPFWRPSVAEYNSLNSLILRPLRAAFSLISTVSQMALFHETDLLPARLLWESSCLALLHCLHRRSPSPAISSLFSRLLAAPPYSGPWQFGSSFVFGTSYLSGGYHPIVHCLDDSGQGEHLGPVFCRSKSDISTCLASVAETVLSLGLPPPVSSL
jgi:hypothetical protein